MAQRAEIIPEAFLNLKYTGFIAEMAPEANRAKARVQAKVKVEKPADQLRPERNARVNFPAAANPAAGGAPVSRVLVPKEAVVRRDGKEVVFVIKGTRVELRSIRVGEELAGFFQVLDGLSGGESIATTGA